MAGIGARLKAIALGRMGGTAGSSILAWSDVIDLAIPAGVRTRDRRPLFFVGDRNDHRRGPCVSGGTGRFCASQVIAVSAGELRILRWIWVALLCVLAGKLAPDPCDPLTGDKEWFRAEVSPDCPLSNTSA